MARRPTTQCEVCGHGTARIADSCWEAQQRMERAEAQAKVAARQVADTQAACDSACEQFEEAQRELEEACALLARRDECTCWRPDVEATGYHNSDCPQERIRAFLARWEEKP